MPGPGVAVVTGAASGIGRAAAQRLVDHGWTVAGVDRSEDSMADLKAASTHACDVADPSAVQATVMAVEDRHGPIVRLVNAAGIAVVGAIGEVSLERATLAMQVNYLGTLHWVHHLLPGMRERRRGDLVLFASLAGWFATPRFGAYTASKFAVVGLAETLKLELDGSGVRLRCICPPSVRTPMLEGIVGQGIDERRLSFPPPLTPERVVDAIDRSLEPGRDDVMIFPGPGSKSAWRMRRIFPRVMELALRRLVPME